MNLKDAVALITGGGSGLGAATAREFAAHGAKIAILDLPSSPGAKVAEELGAKAMFVPADVVSGPEVETAVARAAEHFGTIHLAVNCAGISVGRAQRTLSERGPHSLDLFTKVISVNLIGTFNVIRLAAAQMAKNQPNREGERGVIVNTASVAAFERPRLDWRPGLHDRAGNLRNADAGYVDRRRAQGDRVIDSVSAAAGPSRRVRGAGAAYRREFDVQRSHDPPRRRTAHGSALAALPRPAALRCGRRGYWPGGTGTMGMRTGGSAIGGTSAPIGIIKVPCW
jgi:NAD(P)-dependent dehydrogenase (short-subunit alcohol dehydrogenase family)